MLASADPLSGNAARPRWRFVSRRWVMVLVPLLAVALYLPATRFGLLWDDPTYYQLGSGLDFWRLFGPVPEFQFYRPLALVYNRIFIDSAGLIHSWPRHLVQALFHAANVALAMRLARTLGLGAFAAAVAGLSLALHPFAQQAVACQGSQQPMATLFILGSVLTACLFLEARRSFWLALSLALFALGLLAQESALAVLPVVMVMSLVRQRPANLWRQHRWLLGYVALAACYLAIWVLTPRQGGILGSSDRLLVTAYMGQAVLPPVGGLASLTVDARPVIWLLLAAVGGGLLGWLGWRHNRLAVVVGATLYLAGIAPSVMGLSWAYASVGSRLAYPALPGVALLWAGALGWVGGRRWRGARVVQMALVVALMALLAVSTMRLQRLYIAGTTHLRTTVAELAGRPDDTLLFLNYPDRMALRQPPYALGYWGIILAPPVQRLCGLCGGLAGAQRHSAGAGAPADWRPAVAG